MITGQQKQIAICMLAATALFVFSIWFGYYLAQLDPVLVKKTIEEMFSQFDFVKNLNSFFIFLFIFLNNLIKGFLIVVFGTLFGLAPAVFIFSNGEMIGLVLGVSKLGIGPLKVILGLLPHGILEVPAIIMSSGYGLWLGYRFWRFVFFREPFKIYFSYALKRYVRIIVPLLLVAAIIETFITPLVLGWLE